MSGRQFQWSPPRNFPVRADAAHHLVMDEQDAVAVADLADARIIAVGRDQRGGRGAADRLHDEGERRSPALRPGSSPPACRHSGCRAAPSTGCRGRDRRSAPGSVGIDPHHRREGFGERDVAGDGERAQRAAVIGREAADHLPALRLAGRDRPLPRQLDAGFHRFRTAGDEEDAVEAVRQCAASSRASSSAGSFSKCRR